MKHQAKRTKSTTCWAKRFAVIGLVLPLICLALDFQPAIVQNLCELCWPSGFLLFAAEGHFNLAIYSISIAINMLVWAGLGWLIGYGLSNRTGE